MIKITMKRFSVLLVLLLSLSSCDQEKKTILEIKEDKNIKLAYKFKETFPNSSFNIDSMIHELEYKSVLDSNNVTSYIHFFKNNPKSSHRNEILDSINTLQTLKNKKTKQFVLDSINSVISDNIPNIKLSKERTAPPSYSLFLDNLFPEFGMFSTGIENLNSLSSIKLFEIRSSFKINPWSGWNFKANKIETLKTEGLIIDQIITGKYFELNNYEYNDIYSLKISKRQKKYIYRTDDITYKFDKTGNIIYTSTDIDGEYDSEMNAKYIYNTQHLLTDVFITLKNDIPNKKPINVIYRFNYNKNNKLSSLFVGVFNPNAGAFHRFENISYFKINYNKEENIQDIKKIKRTWADLFKYLNISFEKEPSRKHLNQIRPSDISKYCERLEPKNEICRIKYTKSNHVKSIEYNNKSIIFNYFENAVVALTQKINAEKIAEDSSVKTYSFVEGNIFIFSDISNKLKAVYEITNNFNLKQKRKFTYSDIRVVEVQDPQTDEETVIQYNNFGNTKIKEINKDYTIDYNLAGEISQKEFIEERGWCEKRVNFYHNNYLNNEKVYYSNEGPQGYSLVHEFFFYQTNF